MCVEGTCTRTCMHIMYMYMHVVEGDMLGCTQCRDACTCCGPAPPNAHPIIPPFMQCGRFGMGRSPPPSMFAGSIVCRILCCSVALFAVLWPSSLFCALFVVRHLLRCSTHVVSKRVFVFVNSPELLSPPTPSPPPPQRSPRRPKVADQELSSLFFLIKTDWRRYEF